ncbi:MAG: hypothetical protein H7222_09465 [Methylotenera sp.]|nr:hypothetical protein [Oligoflexia bacterium]
MKHDPLLRTLLSQPSAPFRERHVIAALTHELKQGGVPHFVDPIGNIVVGVANKAEYLKLIKTPSKEPVRIFIAHMDHPGFHGVKWKSPTQLEFKWHGGSPLEHIVGAGVWLADETGPLTHGKIVEVKMLESGRAMKSGVIEFTTSPSQTTLAGLPASSFYGGLSFRATHWQGDGEDSQLIYTKAADDLVGSFAIASVALDLLGIPPAKSGKANTKKKKLTKVPASKRPPFIGLLTRAEEVGFIGAIGHFELGWLKSAKRPLLAVSLETSRTLPGAEIGKGPVVRLGDRFTVFHPGCLHVFTELAKKLLPEKHQRRIMDGGTCEGTTATAYGIPTVGISVPLGNYHNQSFQGGPDSRGPNGPAPEFVHLGDVEALITLCHGLMRPKLDWSNPWASKVAEFKKNLKSYNALLRSGP